MSIGIARIALDRHNSAVDRINEILELTRHLINNGWTTDKMQNDIHFIYNENDFIKVTQDIDDTWGYRTIVLYMTIGNLFIDCESCEFFGDTVSVYQFDRSGDQFTKLFNTCRYGKIDKTHVENLAKIEGEVTLPNMTKSARNF